MDQEIRNKLRNVVTQCRKLLEDSVSQELEGKYVIFAKKDQVTADPNATMTHLTDEEQAARKDILDHFGHIKARGFKPKDALDQLVREIAFTHLNRLCAYKMMEAREVYIGGQRFRDAVGRGVNSNGVMFYLADHPEEERLFNTGHQDVAYRRFLDWLGGLLSDEIGVLFNPNDPANRLYPRQKTLDEVLDLLNNGNIKPEETELREAWPTIWSQDETIGWVYQYFTPKELRDQARKESAAPRNSYELAFRNQFFTPRYVVEFLTDNTLGRIWYEMRKGDTKLKDQCKYMVRRPTEVFLIDGEQPPKDLAEGRDGVSQEDLLKFPAHIQHRQKKDPRDLKILDPASGSGHFLLYCFDLLLTIYEEAYADPDLGSALQRDYSTLEDLQREVPRMILAHNLHGIDIDLRCSQIAALALWLRCQRSYQQMGLRRDRPKITRSNFVCAEPMPGEEQMLREFVGHLEPKLLGQVVEVVFDKMRLAGEAGSLLRIEEEIRDAVAAAKKQWVRETTHATDRKGQSLLFTQAALDRMVGKPDQHSLFDLTDITDDQFFEEAEAKVIEALRRYAEKAQSDQQLQRRLFSDDAVRGFAFVDRCQRRYDVVLMNPPFGVPSKPSQEYLKSTFPRSKNDLFAAFIERGLLLLSARGCLGAITSRTGYFLTSFSKWRDEIVLKYSQPRAFADLGSGVLDTALVETAAYSLEKRSNSTLTTLPSPFFRLLREANKETGLRDAITALNTSPPSLSSSTYLATPESFRHVPGSPFSYWANDAIRSVFRSLPAFDDERHGRSTRCGLGTLDDFRFIRLRWEVKIQDIGSKWRVYYHGGVYSPFHDEFPCVVLWASNGAAVKRYVEEKVGSASRKVQGEGSYFKQGFVFPRRTKGFAPKFMPDGGIFSTAGQAGFVPPDDLAWTIALLSSRICTFLLSLSQGRTGDAAQFEVGLVKRLPWPQPDISTRQELDSLARSAFQITVALRSHRETSHFFVVPPAIRSEGKSLSERHLNWKDEIENTERLLAARQDRINEIAFQLYGVSEADIETSAGCEEVPDSNDDADASHVDDAGSPVVDGEAVEDGALDAASFVQSFVSYLVGCVLGVWDIQRALDKSNGASSLIPTDPLPRYSPGQLNSETGLDQSDGSRQRATEGVLVDDEEHVDDIVRRVRDVVEVLFKERSEEIEHETSHVLGVRELRDYFRKATKGGFWDDHVSRYSNSRRNAPIYWLLQSSKRNYALWLYYHRLDKDLLFKALVNYVEPKIRLESSRLQALRSERAAVGEFGKEAKWLAKEVEQQEDFISELRDFEDKLRRAANLHLEPDLNDGVVLNIAPLHELVPWKEAKNYWDELLGGKYDWSSIGKQLRQKGMVK
ncbi:MAG TPA: BREX-1 system adenine-specific DNA-methyltransferase PglX [Paludibaculum sp.]|jgi:hypothetical protein